MKRLLEITILAMAMLPLGNTRATVPVAMTFTVTNTNASGPGSFAQAIIDANANPGADTIEFNISGAGPHTIKPTSPLPTITDPLTIDGYTQPGASPNTNPPSLGINAVLKIEVDMSIAGGLVIVAGHSRVRGLVINRSVFHGIVVAFGDENVIEGNFIGADVSGATALGNSGYGVWVREASNTVIGGTDAAARNLISGNQGIAILIDLSSGTQVQGNLIGTDVTGLAALGNADNIAVAGAANTLIGGTTAAARNVISASRTFFGVHIYFGSAGTIVQGNYIGSDVTGKNPLGNNNAGIALDTAASNTIIGGTAPGAGNRIAFNGAAGVIVGPDVGAAILSNAIFANAGLGIDLNGDGVTVNDLGDTDTGANGLQNYPILTSAPCSGGGVMVHGTLNGAPNTAFRVEFFSNAPCDDSGFGEGAIFLGSMNAVTDGSGAASFTFTTAVPPGQSITATATDPNNNTSEFSQCLQKCARKNR